MRIEKNQDGVDLLVVPHVEADGITTHHQIPVPDLVHFAELLGYENLIDAVEAIVHIREDKLPDVDPETGENAWSEIFVALSARELAREDEAERAILEGKRDDPRSPRLRSALAARAAGTVAIGADSDRESLPALTQSTARGRLALPVPTRPPSSMRPHRLTCSPQPDCTGEDMRLCAEDRESLHQLLQDRMDGAMRGQGRFLHHLSGRPDNPLEDDPQPEAVEVVTNETVASRYRRESKR